MTMDGVVVTEISRPSYFTGGGQLESYSVYFSAKKNNIVIKIINKARSV